MKYTLICEDTVNNSWKNVSEFQCDFLNDVIDNFDLFLKGCGFIYDGKITIQDDHSFVHQALDEMYDELEEIEKENVSSRVMSFTSDSLSMWDEDSKRIQESNKFFAQQSCGVCGLPLIVAQRHNCTDTSCPVNHAN